MKRQFSLLVIFAMALSLVAVQAFAAGTESGSNVQSQPSQQSVQGTAPGQMKSSGEISGTILRANDIVGKEVKNASGERLGSVEDVAINQEGRISYVILSRGEVLGMGGEWVPIPWDMVKFGAPVERQRTEGKTEAMKSEDVELIVNLSKEDLDNAPTLKSDDWSQLSESSYDGKVHSYYEERRATGAHQQMKHGPATVGPGSEGKKE